MINKVYLLVETDSLHIKKMEFVVDKDNKRYIEKFYLDDKGKLSESMYSRTIFFMDINNNNNFIVDLELEWDDFESRLKKFRDCKNRIKQIKNLLEENDFKKLVKNYEHPDNKLFIATLATDQFHNERIRNYDFTLNQLSKMKNRDASKLKKELDRRVTEHETN